MQQNKNFMLFMLSILCIFASWIWVQNYFWPPKKKPVEVAEKKLDAEKKKPAEVKEDKDAKKPEPVIDAKYLPYLAVMSAFDSAVDAQPWRLVVTVRELEKWLPRFFQPLPEPETVVLGGLNDPRHHMEVTLTTRGAGVRKLVLNKFRAANYLGLPVPDKNQHLELIPDDPFVPSFLMYQYKFSPLSPAELAELENLDKLRAVGPLTKIGDIRRWEYLAQCKGEVPVDTLGQRIWNLDFKSAADAEEQQAVFSIELLPTPVQLIKTYTLKPGAYHIEMVLKIVDKRTAGDPFKFKYELAGAHGIPVEGEWFVTSPRTAVIGTVNKNKQLWRKQEESFRISQMAGGNRVPEADLAPESFLQYAGVMNQFFSSLIVVDSEQAKLKTSDDPRRILAWARPTVESSEQAGIFAALGDKTLALDFLLARNIPRLEEMEMLPRVRKHIEETGIKKGDEVMVSFYRLPNGRKVATWIRLGHTARASLDDFTVRVISQDFNLRPGEKLEHRYLLYNGPSKVKQLFQFAGDDAVPPELVTKYTDTLQLKTVTDFGRFWLWSDLIIACSNIIHFLLYHLRFFGDGMSVVLVTVLVRGLMFPISRKQAIYSVKMQELAPEMKKLQEKFKNDPKARTEATMELYRKHNVHPLGGCLPILLQMPIFIGLYFALQESVHFRLASFLWIENLAAPDMMIWWTQSIPIISDPNGQGGVVMDKGMLTWLATMPRFLYLGPFFNLLPVIAVTFMIIQQKVMTPPPQDEQQAAQFKMMRYMMVLVGVMFYKVAAGLCMYIIISTVWGLTERRFLPKKQTALVQPIAAPPGGQRSGPSGRKQPVVKPPEKPAGNVQKVKDWWQEVLRQAKKK